MSSTFTGKRSSLEDRKEAPAGTCKKPRDNSQDSNNNSHNNSSSSNNNNNNSPFTLVQLYDNPVARRRTNDEVHSSIDMGPVVTAIMDTPQFQRLRLIKQTGTAEYVYCNTNHNRFEHSLGVAYLARKMMQRIHTRQPQLPCDAKDVLCVELAGLLHDIGHGPFSHTYETFLKHALPQFLRERPDHRAHYSRCHHDTTVPQLPTLDLKHWKHEQVSLLMIDAALAYLGLAIDLERLDEPLRQIGDGVDATTLRAFE